MVWTLQSFHSKYTKYLTGDHIRLDTSDPEEKRSIRPPSEGVLEEADLLLIQDHINRRRKSVEKTMSTIKIHR
jgi:hypothetical protein